MAYRPEGTNTMPSRVALSAALSIASWIAAPSLPETTMALGSSGCVVKTEAAEAEMPIQSKQMNLMRTSVVYQSSEAPDCTASYGASPSKESSDSSNPG